MKLIYWLLGFWSHRARATWLYKRGLAHANAHDRQAALADYTAVIEMQGAPLDVQAMALYNRSVIHSSNHDEARAIRDLEKLLEMPQAAGQVRLEARRKLFRMQRTTDRAEHPQSKSES
jgi:tetratricopeptide (TPR) repeat protein